MLSSVLAGTRPHAAHPTDLIALVSTHVRQRERLLDYVDLALVYNRVTSDLQDDNIIFPLSSVPIAGTQPTSGVTRGCFHPSNDANMNEDTRPHLYNLR